MVNQIKKKKINELSIQDLQITCNSEKNYQTTKNGKFSSMR